MLVKVSTCPTRSPSRSPVNLSQTPKAWDKCPVGLQVVHLSSGLSHPPCVVHRKRDHRSMLLLLGQGPVTSGVTSDC